ncbi:MAG: hypothetical protein ACM32I_04900 [Nitrospirota bacterium]
MKNRLIAISIIGVLGLASIGFLYAQTLTYNPAFNPEGMKLQPAPAGHVPGKDNGAGSGLHNSGEDCGMCHTPNGKAGNFVFTVGGTIYEDRAARRPLKGAEVILQDYSGKVISMTTNEAGNFWTFAPIAGNPYAIASHGATELIYSVNADGSVNPADTTDSRTWQYKAWVRNPDGAVRQMVTIPPIGGSTKGSSVRMSCNMHHSPFGSTGAAWASRKSTLATYPVANLSFKKHILPIFRSKCAPCHVPGSTFTRLVTISDVTTASTNTTALPLTNSAVTSIDFSNGHDYQSYDGSTVVTVASGVTTTFVKPGINDMTLPYQADPDASPVLAKTKIQADGVCIHPGGTFWTPDDTDYKAIRQWIAEGALNN